MRDASYELLGEREGPLLVYGWPAGALHYRSLEVISGLAIVIDIITAFEILFCVWFLCEWRIRRAARKGS
jgi:hypothetical protein